MLNEYVKLKLKTLLSTFLIYLIQWLEPEKSYYIFPEFHGKGWGIAPVVRGQSAAKQSGIKSLIGEVMPENSTSSAIFVKLGYDAEVLSNRIRYQKNF